MKKLLLLLVSACLILGVSAQKATEAVKMNQKKLLFDDSEYQRTIIPAIADYSDSFKNAKDDPAKIYVGEAFSQRSFRREDCKVISYNKDLDVITISFVLDEETYPSTALSDGSVAIFYSEDHGQTWSGPVLTSDLSSEDLRNYYLSGVIYNPTGNTNVEDAYGVYQGVAADNALALWNNQAFGTSTLGGANYFTEYFTNSEPNHEHDGYFSQFGLTQKQDIMKCFNVWAEGGWSAFTELKLEDIEGTYNGTGIDWDLEHSVIDMPMNIDPADGEAMWVGKYTFSDLAADMVWSDDAMIGYAWLVGANTEALEATGVQPLLYKTIDGGDSWDYIELDFQDSDWQDVFRNGATEPGDWLILPCRDINEEFTDFTIPWFNATVGAVDANGNLQLFADVQSHYYDIFNDWDYYENFLSRYVLSGTLFKFTIGDELMDITLVDSLMTNAALDDVSGGSNDSLYCGTSGWLHRLQLTKDYRSEEFFLTWTDSEDGNRVQENYQPDIKGWSFNINGGQTEPVCFTCGTTFPLEHYWFVQASEYAYYNFDDSTFTVPMVNAVGLDDFYTNTSGSADPVEASYITEITFDALVPIPTGVDEYSDLSKFEVSQNLPNPALDITTIEINSETVAPVTVEVSNIIGQNVQTIEAGVINGSMKVNIDVSNLEAGVYIYTVTIANNSVSKRMVVR